MALEKKLNCTKGQKQALDYIYIYKFTFDLITVLKSLLDSLDKIPIHLIHINC